MQNWNTINIHNANNRVVIDSNGRAHKVMLREGGWDISPHSGLAVWDAARFLNEMDATLLEDESGRGDAVGSRQVGAL